MNKQRLHKMKRPFALFVAVIMVLALMPAAASAAGPSVTLKVSPTSIVTVQKYQSDTFDEYSFVQGGWAVDPTGDNEDDNYTTLDEWETLRESASAKFTVNYTAGKSEAVKPVLAYKITASTGADTDAKLLIYDNPGEEYVDEYVGKVWDVLSNKEFVAAGGGQPHEDHVAALGVGGYTGYWGPVGGRDLSTNGFTGYEGRATEEDDTTYYFFADTNGTYKIDIAVIDVGEEGSATALATKTITIEVKDCILTVDPTSRSTTKKYPLSTFNGYEFDLGGWASGTGAVAEEATDNVATETAWGTLKSSASTSFTVNYEAVTLPGVRAVLAYNITSADGKIATAKLLAYDKPSTADYNLYVGKVWDVLNNKAFVTDGALATALTNGGYAGYWGPVGGRDLSGGFTGYKSVDDTTYYFFANTNGTYTIDVAVIDINATNATKRVLDTETVTIKVSDASGNGGSVGSSASSYTVKFNSNGGTDVRTQYVVADGKAKLPVAPQKDGFILEGWYTDEALTQKYNFNTPVTGSLTLYAKWAAGGAVTTTPGETLRFNDIASHWARSVILSMADKGIINGYTDSSFKPDNPITRAEYLTMMVKALGVKATAEELAAAGAFADAAQIPSWAAEYVAIGKALGIVEGGTSGNFNPYSQITRQDMFVMTYRALLAMEVIDASSGSSALSGYTDRGDIAAYAAEALQTLAEKDLVAGSGGKLNPKKNATRAEAAQFLSNILDYVAAAPAAPADDGTDAEGNGDAGDTENTEGTEGENGEEDATEGGE